MSSCPPFFVRFADSARRMRPAQVPQVGFLEILQSRYQYVFPRGFMCDESYLTKSRRGSRRLHLWAIREIAVLSPPGITKPSQDFSSFSVRTSINVHSRCGICLSERICAAWRSNCVCSLKAPCKASTPTVMFLFSPMSRNDVCVDVQLFCTRSRDLSKKYLNMKLL